MKLTKEQFFLLQQRWYQLLLEAGFVDIEVLKGDEFVLKQSASYPYQAASTTRESKEEYYRVLSHFAQDEGTVFKNAVDKHVLTRRSEGAKLNTIVEELLALGKSRTRWSVRFIIRRYEMLWGLRYYTARQLNIKS